jgi:hypothetical protein
VYNTAAAGSFPYKLQHIIHLLPTLSTAPNSPPLPPPLAGDHALTALAIGRMLKITGDGSVLTGLELDAMDDAQLEGVVLGCNIFARASPENKLRIVRALQVGHQDATRMSTPAHQPAH